MAETKVPDDVNSEIDKKTEEKAVEEYNKSETAVKIPPSMVIKVPSSLNKKPKNRDKGIYMKSLITKKIVLSVNLIGRNIKENLEKSIINDIEGKCIAEGYIKKNSVELVTYSSGILKDAIAIFDVVFTCQICLPVEGMLIDCVAKNITKAGIRAETNEEISPVTIFIARDHHFSSDLFSRIKENDEIRIRVIGQRFELFDDTISVIGEVVNKNKFTKKGRSSLRKPKLIIQDT